MHCGSPRDITEWLVVVRWCWDCAFESAANRSIPRIRWIFRSTKNLKIIQITNLHSALFGRIHSKKGAMEFSARSTAKGTDCRSGTGIQWTVPRRPLATERERKLFQTLNPRFPSNFHSKHSISTVLRVRGSMPTIHSLQCPDAERPSSQFHRHCTLRLQCAAVLELQSVRPLKWRESAFASS